MIDLHLRPVTGRSTSRCCRSGTVRAAEFRAGRWCDGLLYSRLRTDPAVTV
ncbi:hypothetical protein [Actinoplanes nipponensis]|uniref:hypothetical protein n=1 Tax=Actinoplanes nipponensis TaxID=135950 RepID=UPI0019437D26|nr:hypothetical protein [Actinoplanes nipponensis]